MRGDQYRAGLVHVVIDERIVKGAPCEDIEAQGGFVEHQQFGIDGHGQGQVHLGLHSFRQFAHAALARDLGFGEQRRGPIAAESRVHSGDEIDRVIDPQPTRKHGDVGNEARVVHELGCVCETVRGPTPAAVPRRQSTPGWRAEHWSCRHRWGR